ncbi:MAG: hypothetical protein M1819_000914 [Sarea resinae]|nr:MAG: hypothetical protein M1819_000914 [Sarea resinae]
MGTLQYAGISTIDPAQALRAFFMLAAMTVFLANAVPAFRSRFVAYGSRTASPARERSDKEKRTQPSTSPAAFVHFFDYLSTFLVPHAFFTHFYIASVLSSVFWAYQILAGGRCLTAFLDWTADHSREASMSLDQVALAWSLMALQGIRRLWESIALSKPSQAKMWFVHWLLGISFYVAMGIAVWIEGLPALRFHRPSIDDVALKPPSLRTFLCIPLFFVVSGIQHDAHVHLYSLPKYSLPKHPIFQQIICPHYTAECLIYLSLALIAAPRGALVNQTIFTALIFVSINLGVTANITRQWYAEKFGEEQVRGRCRMIPFVY